MTAPKPYHATPDELCAIEAALLDMDAPPIPADKLVAFYRAEAARLRSEGELAETIEMRVMMLDDASRLDKLAEIFSRRAAA